MPLLIELYHMRKLKKSEKLREPPEGTSVNTKSIITSHHHLVNYHHRHLLKKHFKPYSCRCHREQSEELQLLQKTPAKPASTLWKWTMMTMMMMLMITIWMAIMKIMMVMMMTQKRKVQLDIYDEKM